MDGLDGAAAALRRELRRFLQAETAAGVCDPVGGSFARFDAAFAARLGARGWIGADWPRPFGGLGATLLDRTIIAGELLAHGAPVRAHRVAESLAGPLLLRAGTAAQQHEILPRIAAGRLSLCIGLEEAAVSPDPVAMRTRAVAVVGGWRVTGRKFPVVDAVRCQRMILLARTAPEGAQRGSGLSLFLVDLALPGIRCRPLPDAAGADALAEVVLDGVFLAEDRVIGPVDAGLPEWLAVAEAGLGTPDAWLCGWPLLAGLADALDGTGGAAADAALGRLVADSFALHSLGLAMAAREAPAAETALLAVLAAGPAAALPEAVDRLLPEAVRAGILAKARDAARFGAVPPQPEPWRIARHRLRLGRAGR